MRCFTVTKADHRRFRVLPLIERYGWDPTFVVNGPAQEGDLRSMGVPRSCIKVAGIPDDVGIVGVSMARDWVCQKVMPLNEWSVWVDDNVERVTGLPPEYSATALGLSGAPPGRVSTTWRELFEHELDRDEMADYVGETFTRADETGTIFAAFANETNHYFRGRKWQDYGYCRTQLALYKNDGSTWFPFPTMMFEDGYKSVDVVVRYGSVVINRHAKAVKPMFERGGIGRFEERLPWLQDNCKRIAEMYPGLVKLTGDGTQYGRPDARDFGVAFAKRTAATVNKWRREHGYVV